MKVNPIADLKSRHICCATMLGLFSRAPLYADSNAGDPLHETSRGINWQNFHRLKSECVIFAIRVRGVTCNPGRYKDCQLVWWCD